VCDAVAKKAGRTLWNSVRENGDSLLCRKSWMPGLPEELGACTAWTQTNLFADKLKNLWNRVFSGAEWATWGPRGISADWEEGTIQGGFKRTFFGAALAYSKNTVEVVKEGGKAKGIVTACLIDYDGRVTSADQKSFDGGKGGENAGVTFTYENKDNRILGVVVDTPPELPGVSFEYRARAVTEPLRNDLGPVHGVADLHVHQTADLAFGGRWFWGASSGPIQNALHKEVVTPTGSNLNLGNPSELVKQLTSPTVSLDANILFKVFGGQPQADGIFQYGGEGFPSFKDWPHHADRSHMGTYLDWVKEAHERNQDSHSNLSLMVVSMVNNNVICSVAQTFDRYGNAATYGAGGDVTGWESKTWGCSDHENLGRQLASLHAMEKANDWYRIAMNPWHARKIISDGALAVVVSMESDKPLSSEGNNYGNWVSQLDFYRAGGVSSLQIAHESDSIFCGAALHRNSMAPLQLVQWPLASVADLVASFGQHIFGVDKNGFNNLGITDQGKKLVDEMVARRMPIDLAHTSQRCRADVMARVPAGYALYDSHTKFQSLLTKSGLDREQEFLITPSGVADYKKHQVLIGLRPAPIDLNDAPGSKVVNNCPGSARSFAQMVQYASDQGLTFAMGSDFNGGIGQVGPRYAGGSGRCYAARTDLKKADLLPPGRHVSSYEGDLPPRAKQIGKIAGTNYYTDGMAVIGWEPELVFDLVHNLQTPGAEKLRDSAEAFLQMWERAYPPAGAVTQKPTGTPPGSVAMGGRCTSGDQCKTGRCTGALGAIGVCVCNEDPDCGAGSYCDAGVDLTKNTCVAKKANDVACAVVGGGHQCQSGQCRLGRCYTPASVAMGGTCYVDDACKQGRCSSVDGTRGTCVCKGDDDCSSGSWCDGGIDTTKNSCKPKLASGAVCGHVGDLEVGHRCTSGDCRVSGLSANLRCR
jgi:microsomal dipeptidase-like Zn-dependent dipeptidase